MSKTELQCRKAGVEDYNAVCSIQDGLFVGFDYIPGVYKEFCHEKRHRMYLGEVNGKAVAFHFHYVVPHTGDEVIILMGGGRAGQEEQHTRTFAQLTKDIAIPDIQASFENFRFIGIMNIEYAVRKLESGIWKLIEKWSSFKFLSQRQHLQMIADEERPHRKERCVVRMTPSSSKMIYDRHYSKIETLVNTYGPWLVHGSAWMVAPMNKSSLREATLKYRVAITINRDTVPLALSIFDSLICPYGERGDLFFYGTQLDDLLDHFKYHAEGWLKTAGHCNTGLIIHAPVSMDSTKIRDAIEQRIGLSINVDCQSLAEMTEIGNF